MMKSFKGYYSLIIIGIAAFFIGIWLQFYFVNSHINSHVNNYQTKFLSVIESWPIAITVLLLVGVIPIIEEIVFREWIVRNKYYKAAFFIGVLSFVLYTHKSAVLLLALYLFFILLHDKAKEYSSTIQVLLSSILFAWIHLSLISSFFEGIGPFMQIFGLGVLFGCVRIKFGLPYNIVSHIAYNGLVLVFTTSSFSNYQEVIRLKSCETQVESTPFYVEEYISKNHDTILSYPAKVVSILKETKEVRQSYRISSLTKLMVTHDCVGFDAKCLLADSLIAQWQIKVDTMYSISYELSSNQKYAARAEINKSNYMVTGQSLCDYLFLKFGEVVLVDSKLANTVLYVDVDFLGIKDFDVAKAYLNEENSIMISLRQEPAATIIYSN